MNVFDNFTDAKNCSCCNILFIPDVGNLCNNCFNSRCPLEVEY